MTYRYTIGPKDLGKYEAAFGHYYKLVIKNALTEAAEASRRYMAQASAQVVSPFKGKYNNSWQKSTESWHTARIYNAAKSKGFYYGTVIEQGRRAGAKAPPTKALIPWVQYRMGITGKQAKSVAFLVARKIAKKGIRGRHVMANQLDTLVRLFMSVFTAHLESLYSRRQ